MVIVDAIPPPYEYPIHPGVGAIYKGPNAETIVEGPDGSIIRSDAEGGEVDLKMNNEAILIRERQPENVLISEERKEPAIISEEVVSKVNGPNLIVGKIAQPLSLDENAATTDKTLDLQATANAERGRTVVANSPVGGSYGGGYAPTTISGSQAGFDNKEIERRVNVQRPPPQESRPVIDGHIYPPVMFDDPNISQLIPDGPVIVDEQIARDHLYIEDGPLYHPETGTLYRPGPGTVFRGGPPLPPRRPIAPVRRLNPPVYEYAKFSPTIVLRSGPAITRLDPLLTTIPVSTFLDTAPIYVEPKVLPTVAIAKDTVRTIAESRLDILQPSPYLTPPAIKEPIILNKW